MDWINDQIIRLAQSSLPPGAELVMMEDPSNEYAIYPQDLSGDGVPELTVVYRWQEELYVHILQYRHVGWTIAAAAKGEGYGVAELTAAPVTSRMVNNLIINWRTAEAQTKRAVYEWSPVGFRNIVPDDRSLESRAISLYPGSEKTTSGTRWGYINGIGTMVIPPRFDRAEDFQTNGLAIVSADNGNGLINTTGAYFVRPVYSFIAPFSEGRAVVIDDKGKYKLLNDSGAIVTSNGYSYMADMHDGRAMVNNQLEGGKTVYGYIDRSGKEVIPLRYEDATDFSDRHAVVKIKDNVYALIRHDGSKEAEYHFPFVGVLGDGLLPFQQTANGKYGYINEKGTVKIQPTYSTAFPFQNGRAIVNNAEDFAAEYGVIDTKGNLVIQTIYNDIMAIGQQRYAVGKAIDPDQPFLGSMYAIFDSDGKRLTEFVYTDVQPYRKGLASASNGKTTFFINTSGNPAPGYPQFQGSGILKLEDDLIQVNIDQRIQYANRNGRIVWEPNTVIPLRLPYLVREHKYKPNKDYVVYYPAVEGIADHAAQERLNETLKVMSQVKPIPGDELLGYTYSGDFEVTLFKKNLLEIEMTGYNYPAGAAHGMPTKVYAHIDVSNGDMYTLKDLFKPGSDYVKVLSDIVGEQIKTDPQYDYVFPDTYKGIKPDQPFFVTQDALHLYFEPYEIAPYAAGFPEFRIPYSQIMNIIDERGDFWRSFHP
ncbi:WG repeat-containing protein [Paenibacillus glycanilyticus]|uniref:WG repeat-containing protein n=1 Tax=Paenibacillus glycanilyticus TaxID=126569 RepID=UPI000FD7ACAA|nr:WG repeat-containing protein [Paenibacillus glycanilyticus]